MLKVSEVYEKQVRRTEEKPDGSEYASFGRIFDTRDVLLNKDFIVSVRPHHFTTSGDLQKLDGQFPEGTKFSLLVVDGNSFRSSEIIVVGSFERFCSELESA